ncbi:PKD domain-containing protein [Aestuariivirga sp.]|uniref:PKD domain-containing protein n=1 Tax=Aestuariivirga sp. TaxID=2650926 RepID=UPI003BAC4932
MSILLKRAARLLMVPAVLISFSSLSSAENPAGRAERLRPSFPQVDLAARSAAGSAAVEKLGPNLDAVAAWYGKSAGELKRELLTDRRLRVDRRGRLFVVDELVMPLYGSTPPSIQRGAQDGELSPLDQTFLLHSKAGSAKTIYLNFRGTTITGTAWNEAGNTLNAVPFDIDGNASAFSTAELQRIQYIWQRVSEDYAPFDVDVTTEPPPPERLARASTSDSVYGTTVVITRKAGLYSCSCGGVAYVGVFNGTSEFYKPALVFFDALGNGDEKFVAEAISHETGHNMGLSHDGTASVSYYTGQGNDAATGWAPIMGVGYYKPLVQFSKGEYAGANNKQDDFAVAQSFGLPLRSDDYGSTTAAATAFAATPSGAAATGSMNGVLETAADRDVFAVFAGAGSFSATAAPAARAANSDLVFTLMNSAGAVLAASNPANALNAALTYTIAAQGTYYIEVKGTGQGEAAGTGYSNYGSVGLYKLTASHAVPGNAAPVAVLTATPASGVAPLAVTLDGRRSTDDEAIQSYLWEFGNGTGDTTGTLTNTQRTYTTAGSYTVRLTVVDNKGLRTSTTQTITVSPPVVPKTSAIQAFQMSIKSASSGLASASSTLTVVNQAGQVLAGATVNAVWSGAANQSVNGKTASNGKITFTSPSSKVRSCFILTVTKITATGYSFSPASLPRSQVCR